MNQESDRRAADFAARVKPFARPRYAAAAVGVVLVGVLAFARMAPPADTLAANGAVPAEVQAPSADAPAAPPNAQPANADAGANATGGVAAGQGTSLAAVDMRPMPGPAERTATYEPPARMKTPRPMRGIYLTAYAVGSPTKRARLIELARRTEINTFVIDVKEVGKLSYGTTVALADRVGADTFYTVPNMRAVLEEIRAAGIYPVARIVAFRDEVLAEARPDLSIVKADGSIWKDHHGYGWVDSFNRDVWDYNIAVAREAIEIGFAEVQWDYVRFPDVPSSHMKTAVWPAREGRTKEDAIAEFLAYSRAELSDLGVPVTADVFGLTTSAGNDLGIGQNWRKMVSNTDALLPMIYPSHYARGSYGIQQPNANPYDIVLTALKWAKRNSADAENPARVRPWLQDFSLGKPSYGPAYVRAQIEAVYDAGYEDWVLWNAASNYTEEALADASGRAPRFPIPRAVAEEPGDSGQARDSARERRAGGSGPLGTPVRRPPPDTVGGTR